MNRITKITKRDVFDLFNKGIEQDVFFEVQRIFYPYCGRLEEIEFLERLYDLENMESYDSRFPNAKGDIWQHTVNNDDYPYNWVFEDERFELYEGHDLVFLRFICEVFHPEVRDESKKWRLFFEKINELLKYDEYELYPYQEISGREVFSWRNYSEDNFIFSPYSIRHKNKIRNKEIKITLSIPFRYQVLQIFNEFDETRYFTDESNWNYTMQLSELAMEELKKYYVPKNYENNQYVPAADFDQFVKGTSPFSVFDLIEAYNFLLDDGNTFRTRVNSLFSINQLDFKIAGDGRIVSNQDALFRINPKKPIKETGLEELLEAAEREYSKGNYAYAVEKLWDAFERLKTYYSPNLDKKNSANKIVIEVSSGNKGFEEMFNNEFKEITSIGNEFRIRHHETNKIDISEKIHYQYLYKRCMALISTVLEILK